MLRRDDAWEAWPRRVKRGTLDGMKTAKTAPARAKRVADTAAVEAVYAPGR